MNAFKLIATAALAAAAGLAQAGPEQIGTGPGTFTFEGNKDAAFYVTLGPGTYDFSSFVVADDDLALVDVWLSLSKDKKPNNGNDLSLFTEADAQHFSDTYGPLVLTQTTNIYVDVNTHLGKLQDSDYEGVLTITAVPEPATTAMFLAGLGVLGFVGRRRS